MDTGAALQEFLEYVVWQLIDHPAEASVAHELRGRDRHVYRIVLNEADMGKVIGKNGFTLSAIKSLVDAAAIKHGVRASVRLEHRQDATPDHDPSPSPPDPEPDPEPSEVG